MKLVQTMAYSATVWLLSALINAFLIAVSFSVMHTREGSFFIFLPGILVSLIVSAPGIFCFWIIFLVAVYRNRYGQSLFRLLLGTGICCAFCTGAVVGFLFRNDLAINGWAVAAIAAVSAMISLFAHRQTIIFINQPSNRLNHV